MARRAPGTLGGTFLPMLPEGLRMWAAEFTDRIPHFAGVKLAALDEGAAFTISADSTFSAIYTVDPDEAMRFHRQWGGPWPMDDQPWFVYDPRTASLTPYEEAQ